MWIRGQNCVMLIQRCLSRSGCFPMNMSKDIWLWEMLQLYLDSLCQAIFVLKHKHSVTFFKCIIRTWIGLFRFRSEPKLFERDFCIHMYIDDVPISCTFNYIHDLRGAMLFVSVFSMSETFWSRWTDIWIRLAWIEIERGILNEDLSYLFLFTLPKDGE
jgi:hypothetical protein